MAPGQRFCGVIGEYGADSLTPGVQFAAFVDHNGNALSGSPIASTWLNQGNAAFTATIGTGLLGTNTTLTVTSMQSITPTSATWSSTNGGEVTLNYAHSGPTTVTPLAVGTVITASGFTTTTGSFSGQYAVIAATTTSSASITVIGLNGAAIPNTGTISGLGTFYGNIQPGMTLAGRVGQHSDHLDSCSALRHIGRDRHRRNRHLPAGHSAARYGWLRTDERRQRVHL